MEAPQLRSAHDLKILHSKEPLQGRITASQAKIGARSYTTSTTPENDEIIRKITDLARVNELDEVVYKFERTINGKYKCSFSLGDEQYTSVEARGQEAQRTAIDKALRTTKYSISPIPLHRKEYFAWLADEVSDFGADELDAEYDYFDNFLEDPEEE